jgi:hypothetical protein
MNAKLVDTLAAQAISTSEGVALMAAPFAVIFVVLVAMAYAHAVEVTGRDPVRAALASLRSRVGGK